MLNRYKGIFYGPLIGFGAWVIDGAMHVQEGDGRFRSELVHVHGGTFVYRNFFLVFGLVLGWLLWTRNRREREFRQLSEIYERFHREVADPQGQRVSAILFTTKSEVSNRCQRAFVHNRPNPVATNVEKKITKIVF